MELNQITAVSPIDGRYRNKTNELTEFFSEFALFKYRLKTEVEYFIALCNIPLPGLEDFPHDKFEILRDIYRTFSIDDANAIKKIEATTNHDVKAVEYFLKDCMNEFGLGDYKEFVHFGLTSQDINNTALPMSLKDAHNKVIKPLFEKLQEQINKLYHNPANYPQQPGLVQ